MIQGALNGGGVDSGAGLAFGSYWSGPLHFWGIRSREVKRKEGFYISKSTPPAYSCLFSFALICNPLLSYLSTSILSHWIKLGPFSPLTLAHSIVIWKKKDLKLVSSEVRAMFNGKEGSRFQINERNNFLTRRGSEDAVGYGARQTQVQILTLLLTCFFFLCALVSSYKMERMLSYFYIRDNI